MKSKSSILSYLKALSVAHIFSLLATVIAGGLSLYFIFNDMIFNQKENEHNMDIVERLEKSTSDIVLKNESNKKAFTDICYSINDSRIKNRQDLYRVYKNLLKKDYISFNDFLENFIVWMTFTNTISTDGRNYLSSNEIIKIKNFVSVILQNETDNNLYDGIGDDDKSSLLTIKRLIVNNANNEAIKHELNKIRFSLKEKQQKIKTEVIVNRAALLVSILSLVATILYSRSTNTLLRKLFPKKD